MESKLVNWWICDMVILLVISKALPVLTFLARKEIFLWPHTVTFDLFYMIWRFFAFRHSGAHCAHGRKKLFRNHWPSIIPCTCRQFFFEIPLHTVPKQLKTDWGSKSLPAQLWDWSSLENLVWTRGKLDLVIWVVN